MPPLTTTERLTLGTLAVAWVVPAWWLGASTVQGQVIAAAAGVLAVGFALLTPRPVSGGPRTPGIAPLIVVCILAFLALLLCQALNPDFTFIPNRRPVGLLRPLDHLAWLPSGIAGPFDRRPPDHLYYTNAWRHLLIAGAVLLPLAALALLRRHAAVVRAALALLFVHAVLFSTFAFAHNLSGSKAVLWLVTDANFHLGAPQFFGKNQQAAYQILLLAAALAAWLAPLAIRPWPGLNRRNLWLGLGTLLVLLGTATTRSRAGLAATAVLLLAATVLLLWPHRQEWRRHRRALFALAATGLVACGTLALLPPVRATLHRVAELAREPGDLLVGGAHRRSLHAIAWQMTLDRPWFGHGAGCYLLLFTDYHPRVPAYMEAIRRHNPDTNRIAVTHADGDWVEFTAEYGFVGTALLAAPWLLWLAALQRLRPLAPALLLLGLGPLLVLAHGSIDFVLRNPAILGLAAALALLTLSAARALPGPTATIPA